MSSTTGSAGARGWARRAVAAGADPQGHGPAAPPLDLVRAVVINAAKGLGLSDEVGSLVWADPTAAALASRLPEPPDGWADPWLPGLVHEQAVSAERRSARGAWYTPEPVVRGLMALATGDGLPPSMVVDPTCGGGAFLLAALDRLVELGVTPTDALGRVAATDIDPDAVQVSRWSVWLWAGSRGLTGDGGLGPDTDLDIVVADALDGPPDRWPPRRLVIGNPPFASPLRSGVMPAAAEAFREANRDLLGPYTDLAAIHLLAALHSAADGSTVAMVQPQSVLSGRDTAGLRRHCDRVAPLHALWATRRPVFDAGVRACAVVLRPGSPPPDAVELAAGIDVAMVAAADDGQTSFEPGHWAGLAARALGAPVLPATLGSGSEGAPGVLGDLATATAGFRDEYYGLLAACREWTGHAATEPNRLVTVGAIEPLATTWGRRSARFGGRTWEHPVIDLEALERRLRAWTEQRLVPKVVLATQSRLLEPVVDRAGKLVPATPLIAVTADPGDLDRVAAVLLAPPVVAWAWQRWFGAALAVDALKLAARQVLELPLPPDREAWDEAAALVAVAGSGPQESDVEAGRDRAIEVAAIMNRAYGADDEVFEWWLARACR